MPRPSPPVSPEDIGQHGNAGAIAASADACRRIFDMTGPSPHNAFLSGPLPRLFARTAAPIIFIMAMNGALTVVDAWFLGVYVGADALTAVTLMFPLYMLLVALSTLVAGGMASVLARHLGARDIEAARQTFVGAHALATLICLLLITGFTLGGEAVVARLANGDPRIAAMGYSFISILIYASPLIFFLSLNSDALRSEGKVGLMATISLIVSLANIAFNFLMIVVLERGVAGSATGTVMAQALSFSIVVGYRLRGRTVLKLSSLSTAGWNARWGRFLALGAPQSISFLGVSLSSAAIIAALQIWSAENYASTVAAYGVVTRILTFAFLPLLGLNMAMQTIAGNNFGAALWQRSDAALKLGVLCAFLFCVGLQVLFLTARHRIGSAFVDDPATVAEIARILPVVNALYWIYGPAFLLSGYLQATGEAARAAMVSLSRTYLFALPLTFLLPLAFGEMGIWLSAPAADLLMGLTALAVLAHARARTGRRWGVFRHAA